MLVLPDPLNASRKVRVKRFGLDLPLIDPCVSSTRGMRISPTVVNHQDPPYGAPWPAHLAI